MSLEKEKTDRLYVLNVARQFLQTFEPSSNPLINEHWFHRLCNRNEYDTRCFYSNLRQGAERFLEAFRGSALQRIICASISGKNTEHSFPTDKPVQTPLWIYHANTSCLFATDGIGILRNIAAVTLVAAAFDLCYVKHHQPGITPA